MVDRKRNGQQGRILGFVGVGLDNIDGHQRVTTNEHFLLVGGSAQTHDHMQTTAIRFDEALRRRGKKLQDASVQEIIDIFHQAREQDS